MMKPKLLIKSIIIIILIAQRRNAYATTNEMDSATCATLLPSEDKDADGNLNIHEFLSIIQRMSCTGTSDSQHPKVLSWFEKLATFRVLACESQNKQLSCILDDSDNIIYNFTRDDAMLLEICDYVLTAVDCLAQKPEPVPTQTPVVGVAAPPMSPTQAVSGTLNENIPPAWIPFVNFYKEITAPTPPLTLPQITSNIGSNVGNVIPTPAPTSSPSVTPSPTRTLTKAPTTKPRVGDYLSPINTGPTTRAPVGEITEVKGTAAPEPVSVPIGTTPPPSPPRPAASVPSNPTIIRERVPVVVPVSYSTGSPVVAPITSGGTTVTAPAQPVSVPTKSPTVVITPPVPVPQPQPITQQPQPITQQPQPITQQPQPQPITQQPQLTTQQESCIPPIVDPDYSRCANLLVAMDTDYDSYLNLNEFYNFIVSYSGNVVTGFTTAQENVFYELACECKKLDGASDKCCFRRNARISIDGANTLPTSLRTNEQNATITNICKTILEDLFPGSCEVDSPSINFTLSPNSSFPSTNEGTNSTITLDPNFIATLNSSGFLTTAVDKIDCYAHLLLSDADRDGYLDWAEYIHYLQMHSDCELTSNTLTSIQYEVFGTLSSKCVSSSNANESSECLFPPKFSIAGADVSRDVMSWPQMFFLVETCTTLESALQEFDCGNTPPPIENVISDDLKECTEAMVTADANADEYLDANEYLTFIQEISHCEYFNRLELSHHAMFLTLSCSCPEQSLTYACCLPSNPQINITKANAIASGEIDSYGEDSTTDFLSRVCITTKAMTAECKLASTLVPKGDLCSEQLVAADKDQDNSLDIKEYLSFIQLQYSECSKMESLSLFQRIAFQFLSCFCMKTAGNGIECCSPAKARLNIEAALLTQEERTFDQSYYLTMVCLATNATIQTGCQSLPPSPAPQAKPIHDGQGNAEQATSSSGHSLSSMFMFCFATVLSVSISLNVLFD